MYENERLEERVVLLAITSGDEEEVQRSLDELGELAKTAGAEVVTRVVQSRTAPDRATYIGSGKIEEVKEVMYTLDANGVICDDELSPAQMRNLQEALGAKVMDRTLLILDIFAGRAQTREGKIQVELAQLRYRASRLSGLGRSLSRLGGGIGTRGPGETKLEVDRRVISERISSLKRDLSEIRAHRDLIWSGRKRKHIPTAAIVGYTNAGKSTLLNTLTDAGILAEDALFATLDPTTRLYELPGGTQVLLVDTVGFIRKLPHHLIEAFRSTLEEATFADLIIHVADASNPNLYQQMQTVYETLHELGADEKPIITLFNKCDLISDAHDVPLRDLRADRSLIVSAKHGKGLEEVGGAIEEILRDGQICIERVIPYEKTGLISQIREMGELVEASYQDDGIHIRAYVPKELYGRLF